MERLLPAETHAFRGPLPTQIVSSDEYAPTPQTPSQRAVEARVTALGDDDTRLAGLVRMREAVGLAG